MNRYPLWKYIVIVVALVIGLVYTLPNFYGESPAVQVSSGKATVKVTARLLGLAPPHQPPRGKDGRARGQRPAEHRARTLRAD
mgnify:CR=1 FL=1